MKESIKLKKDFKLIFNFKKTIDGKILNDFSFIKIVFISKKEKTVIKSKPNRFFYDIDGCKIPIQYKILNKIFTINYLKEYKHYKSEILIIKKFDFFVFRLGCTTLIVSSKFDSFDLCFKDQILEDIGLWYDVMKTKIYKISYQKDFNKTICKILENDIVISEKHFN